MKRYLAFAGSTYYPSGGMNDFIGSFDTVDEAIAEICYSDEDYGMINDWGHVFDQVDEIRVYKL